MSRYLPFLISATITLIPTAAIAKFFDIPVWEAAVVIINPVAFCVIIKAGIRSIKRRTTTLFKGSDISVLLISILAINGLLWQATAIRMGLNSVVIVSIAMALIVDFALLALVTWLSPRINDYLITSTK